MHMHWCLWMMASSLLVVWTAVVWRIWSSATGSDAVMRSRCDHLFHMRPWEATVGGNREPELHLFMLTKFSVKFSVQALSAVRILVRSVWYSGQKVAVDSRSGHGRTQSDAACLHSAVCLPVGGPRLKISGKMLSSRGICAWTVAAWTRSSCDTR